MSQKRRVDVDPPSSSSASTNKILRYEDIVGVSNLNANLPTRNPYNNAQFSQRYFDLLTKRKKLPVWEYQEKFMNILRSNQCHVRYIS